MAKKLFALLFTLVLVFSAVSALAESETPVITELPIYYYDSVNKETLDVAFFNGCMDIPYCSAETVVQLMSNMTDSDMESGYTTYGSLAEANLLSIGEEDPDSEVFYFLRENGALVFFDFEENVIWINDRDLLVAKPYAVSGGDLLYADGYFYNDDNTILMDSDNDRPLVNLYRRVAKNSYKREGEVTVIYLNDYNISMELYDGHYYVPLATVSDILTPDPITFNGEWAACGWELADDWTAYDNLYLRFAAATTGAVVLYVNGDSDAAEVGKAEAGVDSLVADLTGITNVSSMMIKSEVATSVTLVCLQLRENGTDPTGLETIHQFTDSPINRSIIEVFTLTGQPVHRFTDSPINQFPFSPGVYIIRYNGNTTKLMVR